jgi:hypothetical protein
MSNWKFHCMHCGKENVGDGLGHCPDRCSSPEAHAERLRVARDGADIAVAHLRCFGLSHASIADIADIAKLIDARIEPALLKRGGM